MIYLIETTGAHAAPMIRATRIPLLLRVTRDDVTAKVDVLDLVDDTPKATERILVYLREPDPRSTGFIDFRRGKNADGGAFQSYRYHPSPVFPPEDVARDTKRWQEWCQANEDAIRDAFSKQEARQ